jgi:hypothetical protein
MPWRTHAGCSSRYWVRCCAASVLAMAIAADAAHHDSVGNVVHDAWRRQTGRILAQREHEADRDGWLARWLGGWPGEWGVRSQWPRLRR